MFCAALAQDIASEGIRVDEQVYKAVVVRFQQH